MRLAFATCLNLGKLTPDDQLAADLLQHQNIIVDAASWDDPEVKWDKYDAVILRSTWNYHRQLPQFLRWLEMLDNAKVRVWNPTNVIRRNVSKKYLIDFQNAGIPIVPTVFIPANETAKLKSVLQNQNWNRVIIKPEVSASAYLTISGSLSSASDDQQQMDEILKTSGALIQEFRNEIIESGEWSLIFFDRKFSHAVLKHPSGGDFRVQEELGGIISAEIPSESLINQAQKVLQQVNAPLLYARVDGIHTKDVFLLMELELIEPSLFMGFSTGAPQRFANSVIKLL
jgi:glutathione synthase/RimK-type ligase-like ATP-grasp enzyme